MNIFKPVPSFSSYQVTPWQLSVYTYSPVLFIVMFIPNLRIFIFIFVGFAQKSKKMHSIVA